MLATLSLVLKLGLVASPAAAPAPPAPCFDTRLLDGRTVTLCPGHVASVRDDLGNARLYGIELPQGSHGEELR